MLDALKVCSGVGVPGLGEFCKSEDRNITGFQRKDTFTGTKSSEDLIGTVRLGDEIVGSGGETLNHFVEGAV